MISKKIFLRKLKAAKDHAAAHSIRYLQESVPKFEIPPGSMAPEAAYQLVRDELNLDGNPALNLASFVTTWMEPEADRLIQENVNKNFIDHFEYPRTRVIQDRVVNMLGRLYNAPQETDFAGTSTIGSSEAVMLALLAHKWNWKKRRQAQGKPFDRPNIVFGADVHVCWDKFAKYFDVEARIIPMEPDRFTITAETVRQRLDENTMAVGAVVGTTFTGESDPVQEINDLLLAVKAEKGWDIPIHVDAASGGFITPFINPEFAWDFRLSQVKSINVSGHKYGLVYAGVGWLLFRSHEELPEDLVFYVNYLGDEMPTYTLNFTRGGAMVVAQYYNLLRLGREGYTAIAAKVMDDARYLAGRLAVAGRFELLNAAALLPIITFKLQAAASFTVFALSQKLRERGWIVPAYTLPPHAEGTAIMRIVVKENFNRDMMDLFFEDIKWACQELEVCNPTGKAPTRSPRRGHHMA